MSIGACLHDLCEQSLEERFRLRGSLEKQFEHADEKCTTQLRVVDLS